MSDPAIREALLDALPPGKFVRVDSIDELRARCGLRRFTNKQIRRAVESARYGHFQIALNRPRIDEMTRGWSIFRARHAGR